MKQGDRLVCLRTVNNYVNQPLFIEGKEYEVLYLISDDQNPENMEVCLNHIMYANTYNTWPISWVNENFKPRQELREETINKIIE